MGHRQAFGPSSALYTVPARSGAPSQSDNAGRDRGAPGSVDADRGEPRCQRVLGKRLCNASSVLGMATARSRSSKIGRKAACRRSSPHGAVTRCCLYGCAKKASLLHRADCYRDVGLGGSPGRRAAITAVDFAKATVIPVEASDPNGPAAVLVESHIRTRRQRPKSDNECVHRFGIFAEQSLMRSRRALQCWKPVLKHSSDSAFADRRRALTLRSPAGPRS